MSKTITAVVLFFVTAKVVSAFSMAGHGENYPFVSSFESGGYYVRSVPSTDFGTEGTTTLYRVTKEGDRKIDTYPFFMRGVLFLQSLPDSGEWAIIQVETTRIRSVDDFASEDHIQRLVFYRAGKMIRAYSGDELKKLELIFFRSRLSSPGDFNVAGIEQVPGTNRYFVQIDRLGKDQKTENVDFDVATGSLLKQTR